MSTKTINPTWTDNFNLPDTISQRLEAALTPLEPCAETRELLERLLETIARHIENGTAENGWEFLEAPEVPEALVRLAFGAPFLVNQMLREPQRLMGGLMNELNQGLETLLLPWSQYAPEAPPGEIADESRFMRALRLWKYDNYTRITARDLMGFWGTESTCRAVSLLAEGIIEQAYRYAFRALVARKGLPMRKNGDAGLGAVIGMGKLGGGELNYSSDVDLIFIHTSDEVACRPLAPEHFPPDANDTPVSLDPTTETLAYWEKWQKAAEHTTESSDFYSGGEFHNQLARHVVKLVNTNTVEGIGFRVDVDLRPQGKSGLLAPAMSFLLQYYDVQGREWERTAMLKARCVAGSRDTWERFQEVRIPFVYRRYLDFSAVEGVATVKHDIDRNHRGVLTDNLKLGEGGIRENEFFVQAIQLLYGGKLPALRVTNHAKTLEAITKEKLLPETEAKEHLADYWLLRRYENRVQMVSEGQVCSLPEEETERRRVLHDFQPDFDSRQATLEETLNQARARTGKRFHELFANMGDSEYTDPALWQAAVREHVPEEEQEESLARIDQMLNRLMKTRQGERCVFKLGRMLTYPALYRSGINPAFPRWLSFLEQIGNRNALYTLMDTRSEVIGLVTTLFCDGGRHAELLVRHPEFLESYLSFSQEALDQVSGVYSTILEKNLDEEEFILEIQMAKNQVVLQIISAYLNSDAPPHHRWLTSLADATVAACLAFSWHWVGRRMGYPEGCDETSPVTGFTVLTLGRVGSQETRFGSDLDLMYVYRQEGTTSKGKSHYEFYTRLAQKLNNLLTSPTQFGKLYEIDHRLRPFGGKGALVPLLSGLTDFLASADVWNFQSFTRMRRVCGEVELAQEAESAVAQAWQTRGLPLHETAQAVREMLGRLVAEHERETANVAPALPLKYSVGGMIGYEFFKQLVVLQARQKTGDWTTPGTHPILEKLAPTYSLVSELDERLSFFGPQPDHVYTENYAQRLASVNKEWAFTHIQETMASAEQDIEKAFAEFLK